MQLFPMLKRNLKCDAKACETSGSCRPGATLPIASAQLALVLLTAL
ncbi:MAG: hypothetical protein K2Y01_10960 [Rhabdochlamydiaceae bacterium]|nr:hypothetical protein [Rhabdochlamydiaceae bacterium]